MDAYVKIECMHRPLRELYTIFLHTFLKFDLHFFLCKKSQQVKSQIKIVNVSQHVLQN